MLEILTLVAALTFGPDAQAAYLNSCIADNSSPLALPVRVGICKCVLAKLEGAPPSTTVQDIQNITNACAADKKPS